MCRIRIRIETYGFNWVSRSGSGLGTRSQAGQEDPGKIRVADPDAHYFLKLYPDPHKREKLDPDLH
jgi:hypothetical protein